MLAMVGVGVLAVLWGAMWAARRWVGRWFAVAIGGAALCYPGYRIAEGLKLCAGDPAGAGRFSCDSGTFDHFLLFRLLPALAAAVVLLVLHVALRAEAGR